MSIARIGLDLAKAVFQVHGIDTNGVTVVRRRLARSQLLTFFMRLERRKKGPRPLRPGTADQRRTHPHLALADRLVGQAHRLKLTPPAVT